MVVRVRPWFNMWLEYVSWYTRLVSDDSISIEEIGSPPVVPLSFARSRKKVMIFRDGLLFRCDDRVRTSPVLSGLGGAGGADAYF